MYWPHATDRAVDVLLAVLQRRFPDATRQDAVDILSAVRQSNDPPPPEAGYGPEMERALDEWY